MFLPSIAFPIFRHEWGHFWTPTICKLTAKAKGINCFACSGGKKGLNKLGVGDTVQRGVNNKINILLFIMYNVSYNKMCSN